MVLDVKIMAHTEIPLYMKQTLIFSLHEAGDNVSFSVLKPFCQLCGCETLVPFEEIRVGRPDGFNVTPQPVRAVATWRSGPKTNI